MTTPETTTPEADTTQALDDLAQEIHDNAPLMHQTDGMISHLLTLDQWDRWCALVARDKLLRPVQPKVKTRHTIAGTAYHHKDNLDAARAIKTACIFASKIVGEMPHSMDREEKDQRRNVQGAITDITQWADDILAREAAPPTEATRSYTFRVFLTEEGAQWQYVTVEAKSMLEAWCALDQKHTKAKRAERVPNFRRGVLPDGVTVVDLNRAESTSVPSSLDPLKMVYTAPVASGHRVAFIWSDITQEPTQ